MYGASAQHFVTHKSDSCIPHALCCDCPSKCDALNKTEYMTERESELHKHVNVLMHEKKLTHFKWEIASKVVC